ncbi:ribosomal protein S18 acetylase RimI-like enzyme [Alkalihalobacillus xiaoxiensis]|uniref:Ribosomal protein S18 acetylase RimI-like enzyme n=1 Tax=Shouchella xiaoxiensis TaxID=766895 RepID=A0ABS2SUN9_9BACI|nr:GNAT family N-acetyltransferase [Shouchella xiaoxiensis]MBM7838891.1 ribosomal protein S18 acetylase RimI-like enzyme [Shouchella xiaoxiensis]
MHVRTYQKTDEQGWLRCRVLAFLNTSYFDNVLIKKETYVNSSIELVAIIDDQIVGLLDLEYEESDHTVCTLGTGRGGMIWHVAIHPDFRRRGIAQTILGEALKRADKLGLAYLEAWTRDDDWVHAWYEKQGFTKRSSYLHVYAEGANEMDRWFDGVEIETKPQFLFAHYLGDEKEQIKQSFQRVYECSGYVKTLLD